MANEKLDTKCLQDLYFDSSDILLKHQYDSFHQFIDEIIYNELKNNDNIFYESVGKEYIYRYGFYFENISLKPPIFDNEEEIMYPHDARKRHMNYASKLIATVKQFQRTINIMTGEVTEKIVGNPENDVPLGKIFIMVKSKYCSTNIKKLLIESVDMI